jgi:hypothetical protein
MMVPRGDGASYVDVTSAMDEPLGTGGFVPVDALTGSMHLDEEDR